MHHQILIYSDKGADPFSVASLEASLKQEIQEDYVDHPYSIVWADQHTHKNTNWIKNTKLLIFPGGRDIPYHRALRGIANQNISEFVKQGGTYFGICAGAYYGCASIEFEKDTNLSVQAKRELKFFPGIARGPAYGTGKFCYTSQQGAQIANLTDRSGNHFSAYYNGGCHFVDADLFNDVLVLADYSDIKDKPAAVVYCKIGDGRAILCGVHPEYSAFHHITPIYIQIPLFTKLQEIDKSRKMLFKKLLKMALL